MDAADVGTGRSHCRQYPPTVGDTRAPGSSVGVWLPRLEYRPWKRRPEDDFHKREPVTSPQSWMLDSSAAGMLSERFRNGRPSMQWMKSPLSPVILGLPLRSPIESRNPAPAMGETGQMSRFAPHPATPSIRFRQLIPVVASPPCPATQPFYCCVDFPCVTVLAVENDLVRWPSGSAALPPCEKSSLPLISAPFRLSGAVGLNERQWQRDATIRAMDWLRFRSAAQYSAPQLVERCWAYSRFQ